MNEITLDEMLMLQSEMLSAYSAFLKQDYELAKTRMESCYRMFKVLKGRVDGSSSLGKMPEVS